MSDNQFLTAALAYAKRGWAIFPCSPRTKIPLKGTQGCKDASSDEATIRAWWDRWPEANVALACGPESGVYVVDLDVDEEKGKDGWKTLESLGIKLPVSVRQDTPRGGAHFLYQSANPPRNKNDLFPAIDIRAAGYYIMLAPSVHPNGKVYAWAPGFGPDDAPLAEFPDEMRPPEPKKPTMPWEKKAKTTATASPSPASTPIIDRARLYLAECEPSLDGQDGASKLLWAARAMVVGFNLDDSTALSLLWSDFNPRCNPVYDRNDEKAQRIYERKVREARTSPSSKPAGWLLEEYGLDQKDSKLADFGSRLADDLLKEPEVPQILVPTELCKATSKAGDWPSALMNPPGFVGDVASWITRTAECQQPKLSILCSLVSAGALFGGKVKDISNGRTNLYGWGIAPSSAGKDRPFKAIAELFMSSGAEALLGPGRVTSDSALELALQTTRCMVLGIEEAGEFLSGIKKSGGSGGGSHLLTIKPCLKDIWSKAGDMYRGKQKAIGEFVKIREPHLNLWCTSTHGRFYEGVTKADIEDGFLPRFIFVVSEFHPKFEIVERVPPPENLIAVTSAWFNRVVQPSSEDEGDIFTAAGSHQILVEYKPVVGKMIADFDKYCRKLLREGETKGEETAPLWGKATENARKIALILASGEEYSNPELKDYHQEYGNIFAKQAIVDLVDSMKMQMSENEAESAKQKIFKLISRYGAEGISKSELIAKTRNLATGKIRDAYLADLQDAEMINIGTDPKHPKARKGWIWRHPFGIEQKAGDE